MRAGPLQSGAVLAAAFALHACAAAPWSPDELAAREPTLAAVGAHRLADVHPLVLPWHSQVHLLLCRWDTRTPLGVSLPVSAEPDELRALESALRAAERLGLGLRFEEVRADEAALVIELVDGPVQTAAGMGAGRTVADCRVDLASLGGAAGRVGAELVAARVELARSAEDVRGLRVALSDEELAGAALHELGHALGFQGHVSRGETPLVRAVEVHRRLGARVLAGETPDEPSLRALYALPSGTLLASPAVSRWRTDLVDRMGALAAAEGLEGPFARVGDTAARVFWRDASGREYGLQIPNLAETLRDPSRVLVIAEAATRAALPRSRDLPPR